MSASSTLRPTRIRLRPWQSEALDELSLKASRDFLAVATPGAGKTTFALAAAVQDLVENPGRRLLVVAPTQHLKVQWADAAARFGLHLEPDWSTRDGSLPSDMHGVVTTYQQVATSAAALAPLAAGAFVIFDEIHHAADDRSWGTAVQEAFGGAAMRLSLSGTPFRSDTSAIPFIDYHLDEARADYEYGYGEALADGGVVRPVYFPRINGFMEWVSPAGDVVAATFEDELPRELANQRLRTALSLEGEWLPTVVEQAHDRLMDLRRSHPEAGGLIIASDQTHALQIAELLERRHRVTAVVAVSDDPQASSKIAAFAAGEQPWIVAVRMVSEGVDIPRLRIAVFATTTTTELFFRQAVGRVVRWTRGVPRQKAFFFLPDDARLRHFAATLTEARRHSLKKRSDDDRPENQLEAEPELDPIDGADEEQMSLFSVIGSVALGEAGESAPGQKMGLDSDTGAGGVFGDDPDGRLNDPREDLGVDLVLLPPPLPGGGAPRGSDANGSADGPLEGLSLSQQKVRLRDANADVVRELVRYTGWSHPQVNAELNRLSGVRRISEATHQQLEVRLKAAKKWLRST
ncbi:MAG TPA: DEAD/DEAH box helicase [Microthrixaceae bacterium]|nr:DEAD/DEAH box helicase [Microthrixaceae bacterium]